MPPTDLSGAMERGREDGGRARIEVSHFGLGDWRVELGQRTTEGGREREGAREGQRNGKGFQHG